MIWKGKLGMPPKAKFTKDEIIKVAFEIARKKGLGFITARNLGDKLGSSARPIFTVFQNMEEVDVEVVNAAKELYKKYVERGLSQTLAFKGVGEEYIRFAIQEPKLFQLLFMNEKQNKTELEDVLMFIDDSYTKILASVKGSYGLSVEEAKKLYQHLWIYTHGVATLCATQVCIFREGQISDMITEVFVSLIQKVKGEV